ncbi:MAG: DegT/DnrJ/EryC1/StrS family aminotransferase [Betaproteobacteria bacterium]|nr:DegT/DnrJ/EryC1/StrS family aminotransferase [Betaproteobacteria bacterium]
MRVPFVDLSLRFATYRQAFHAALDSILDHGQCILGPEVEQFETAIANFCSSRHAIAVANGTDALVLSLKASGIEAGDEVITTPMSYLASTSSIVLAGATPVFADVGGDLNLDPDAVEAAITPRTKAILLVHLAGNPAQVDRLADLARRYRLSLLEDCAQAVGATYEGQTVGTFGDFGAVSLHPLKNLGTLGDAGVILTNHDGMAGWLRVARNHGHSSRDQCEFWSINSRLDSLHAAFLIEMLSDLPNFLVERRKQAARYQEGLAGWVGFPSVAATAKPTFNMFMILVERREDLQRHLYHHGIETRIHYPLLIPNMKAAAGIRRPNSLKKAESYSSSILSLPMGIHLSNEQIDFTIEQIVEYCNKANPKAESFRMAHS